MSAPTRVRRVCTRTDCDNPHESHGLCGKHVKQANRGSKQLGRGRAYKRNAGERTWTDQAACRSEDPELFFPVNEAPGSPPVAAARRVCAGCPVLTSCRAWAIDNQPDGIAGGLTSDERAALRRNRGQR